MTDQKQPQSASNGQETNKDEMDLTTILDENQRADLTLLIAKLTESMRKLIQDNFNSTAGLNKSLLREGMSEDEKMMAADPHADVSEFERERKLKEENDKDLATAKMKNLKKDALKAYDDWREHVIMRVGEVVNSGRTAKQHVKQSAGKADISKPTAPMTTGKVMEAGNKAVNLKFKDLFPPAKTPLTKMAMKERTLVLHSILLLLISLEHYNAYSRILMLNLTSSLKLPLKTFEQDEYTTAKGLLEHAREMTADEAMQAKIEANKDSRRRKVALATAAGAAILGVSGGLAAPLVAAGVGSVMGGLGLGATSAAAYLGSVAGSTMLVGGLFGAYGGRMTGQMMDQYAREVEDFQFLPVHGASDKRTSENEDEGAKQASEHDHKLRVTVGVSGWLTEKEEVVKPWRVLGTGAEVFALKFELEALLNLGNAMNGVVQSAAWGYAQNEIVKRTIFAELAGAMWPVALMKVARVIDNPFSVAKTRAEKAGEVLADALVNRAQGERPVTLMGYSLGARVVYTCLMSLARRGQFGIVENAVLIGSPTPSDTSDWRVLRSVVAGRLVNVYSKNDYVLGFMYRTSAVQFGVAGLQKVEGLSGVENFDVSEDVSSHQRYRYLIGAILKKIGFEDIDMDAVERERVLLVEMEEEEKKESLASQKRWLTRRESTGGKEDEAAEAEVEADELEKKVEDQTKKTLVTRAIEYFYVPNLPSKKDVDKAAGNVQKVARDPTQAGNLVGQTAKDAQDSTESYATRLYKSLPSMPYTSKTTPAGAAQKKTPMDVKKVTDQAGKTTKGATDQGQSYISQASSYLPSLSSLRSGKEQQGQKKTPTGKTGDSATKAADTTASTAKGAAGVVSDTVTTTVHNTLDPKDNPAVKSTSRIADKAPIIHQAKDQTPQPVKDQAGDVSDAVGTTAQNTGQTVQKGLDTTAGKAGDAGKIAVGGGQDAAKTAEQTMQKGLDAATGKAGDAGKAATGQAANAAKAGQTYTSRAASYLPGMSRLGFGGGGGGGGAGADKKAPPPKLEKRTSSSKNVNAQRPKLDKASSGSGAGEKEKARPPKLDRLPSGKGKLERTPSGIKSPPAKLERQTSGMKSPPAKLERQTSGMKSPPAKLERQPSGMKSPAPAKLERLSSGAKSPATSVPTPDLVKQVSGARSQLVPKLGPRRTSSQQQAGVRSPLSASAGQQPGAAPSAESIGERLASIPSGATGAAQGVGEKAKGALTGSGPRSTDPSESKQNNESKEKDKEKEKVGTAGPTSTSQGPGADAGAQGVISNASKAGGKATEVGQSVGSTAIQGAGKATDVGKSAGTAAVGAAGKAGDVGKGAAQQGGKMLAGAGKFVGFGR
ncbi:hypothetical protein LTR06_001922 [Exophiala xenobiotica]|nr:hypothetical protein LTR06_001922 [Exophiala xenobiotica]